MEGEIMILNKYDRATIVNWAKENAFKEEVEALREEEHALAERIRVAYNGGEKACAAIDKAPAHHFNTSNCASCSGGRYMYLKTYDRYTARPAETFDRNLGREEAISIDDRKRAIAKKRLELGWQLEKTLESLKTVEKVRELLPEFASLLPDPKTKDSMLPMVIINSAATREALVESGVLAAATKK
jgi:hypothetical protein